MKQGGWSAQTRWPRFLLLGAAVLGFLNMLVRVGGHPTSADFRLFWLAGRAWRAGINPYGSAYRPLGIALFGEWSPIATWLYPPHFLPLTLLYSLPPARAGLIAWNMTGLALAVVAAVLLARLFACTRPERLMLVLAMIAYLGIMTASGSALQVGQIAFVELFGVALIAWGIGRGAPWVGAIGMAIVMLKPQLGIVLCCTVPFFRGGIKMTGFAILLVAVASLPGLIIGGVASTVTSFLGNMLNYRSIAYNLPASMTGLANPIEAVTGREMPAIPMSLAACALCVVAMAIVRKLDKDALAPRRAAATYLLLSLGAVAGLVMLHIYDLVILMPLIALAPLLRRRDALLLAAPLAILLRPENVARLVQATGPRLASVGCVLLMLACLAVLWRGALATEDGAASAAD